MKKIILFTLLVLATNAFGHGDHAEPGAIPPAPHGGTVSEAKHHEHHGHNHDHKKSEKKEIFFEAIYKGKTLKIYPLILDPKTFKTFFAQEVAGFKNTKITLKDPRKKKEFIVKPTPKGDYWLVSMEKVKGRRLIVHVSSQVDGENYKAKIQVERK